MGESFDVAAVRAGGGLNVTGSPLGPSNDFADTHGAEFSGRGTKTGDYVVSSIHGEEGTTYGPNSTTSKDENGDFVFAHLAVSGSDHLLRGLEYVPPYDSGRAKHDAAIDDEITNVPPESLRTEGTTFVTESLYVAVHGTKSVKLTGKGLASTNSLGRGDKDTDHTTEKHGT